MPLRPIPGFLQTLNHNMSANKTSLLRRETMECRLPQSQFGQHRAHQFYPWFDFSLPPPLTSVMHLPMKIIVKAAWWWRGAK
jgi:hypothetical protein